MISQAQLEYILALLKHNNFQRAAEECHVTQPTLSMQLKKAEESIGYKIINRDTTPISLTDAGKQLLPQFTTILDGFEHLDIEIQKLKGTYKAEVRIGVIPTISNYLVPELYAKWKNQLDEVRLDIIELTSEQLLLALRNKEVDLGIMAGPLNDSQFESQILYHEEIKVYAPRIKSKKVTLQQLEKEQPWLLSPGNCLRTQMINLCQVKDKNTDLWNYEGGNLPLLTKMVEQEGGYTLIPSQFIPYLNIDQTALKKIENHSPIRQVIGLHLKRNTKKKDIQQILRIIQRNKSNSEISLERADLLPWDG